MGTPPGGGWQPPSGTPPQWQPPPPAWPPQEPPQQPPTWPPQQPGYGGGPHSETSGKAIASLILGICGLFICPIILSIVALVLGYQARSEIDRSGGRMGGRGNAKAGIILGWIGLVLGLLVIVGFFALGLIGAFEDTTEPFEFEDDFSLYQGIVGLVGAVPTP